MLLKLIDVYDKIKRDFSQAVTLSILLYRCTTWTLTKRMKKKLDANYARMLRVILNKAAAEWSQTIKVRLLEKLRSNVLL